MLLGTTKFQSELRTSILCYIIYAIDWSLKIVWQMSFPWNWVIFKSYADAFSSF